MIVHFETSISQTKFHQKLWMLYFPVSSILDFLIFTIHFNEKINLRRYEEFRQIRRIIAWRSPEMFSSEQKTWIVLEYGKTSCPTALKRKFVLHFNIKGRKKNKYQPHLFLRVVESFKRNGISKEKFQSSRWTCGICKASFSIACAEFYELWMWWSLVFWQFVESSWWDVAELLQWQVVGLLVLR